MAAGTGTEAYYRRRAREYDRVYDKPERQADLAVLRTRVASLLAGRRVLEVAAGTGWWTDVYADGARRVLATDVNPETLAVAATRRRWPASVRFARCDAFEAAGLEGDFDAVFAGFFWSHVPLHRLDGLLAALTGRVRQPKGGPHDQPPGDPGDARDARDARRADPHDEPPGDPGDARRAHPHDEHPAGESGPDPGGRPPGRLVFIDNRYVAGSNHPITRTDEEGNTYQRRRLGDGSEWEVLKGFPTAAQVEARLAGPGAAIAVTVEELDYYWLAVCDLPASGTTPAGA